MEEVIYLTPKEIAARYHISMRTVRNAIKRGTLPAVRVGWQYRVTEAAVQRWVKEAGKEREDAR